MALLSLIDTLLHSCHLEGSLIVFDAETKVLDTEIFNHLSYGITFVLGEAFTVEGNKLALTHRYGGKSRRLKDTLKAFDNFNAKQQNCIKHVYFESVSSTLYIEIKHKC